jgi:hypothetical protein
MVLVVFGMLVMMLVMLLVMLLVTLVTLVMMVVVVKAVVGVGLRGPHVTRQQQDSDSSAQTQQRIA